MNRIELPTQSGAYRWYYLDVTAGDCTAVFIFMVGSIFSARYSTALKKGGLPREHAAVNFALYEKGVRTQWVLTEYGDLSLSPDGRRLQIGRSWLQYDEGRLTAEIQDKTTPFLVTGWGEPAHVTLDFTPESPRGPEVELLPGRSHRWQAIAARGRATVRLLHQDRVLQGRGYHDGNHGQVPLGSDLRGWEWFRVHSPAATEVIYQPWGAAQDTHLSVTATSANAVSIPHAEVPHTRTNWGLKVPQRLGLPGEPMLLESSPFYARSEITTADAHALGEVADFQRFHAPSVRWMANFKTRKGSAA